MFFLKPFCTPPADLAKRHRIQTFAIMYFDLSVHHSPVTKMPESYFRIKESYRDFAGVNRTRILLTPGFIPEPDSEQRKQVATLLTYWKDNRRQASVFAIEEDYEPVVVEFARKYWLQIQEKGTLDIPVENKKSAKGT